MVTAGVERDLAELAARDKSVLDSALAAVALELAGLLDDPGNSATSKSMCARVLRETMDRLRELVPADVAEDGLDELGSRRAKRLAG